MNILHAFEDNNLLGSSLGNLATWQPWLSFVKAAYGLPMNEEDLTRFRLHTGRETPRHNGYSEVVCIVGCQSGKSMIGSMIQAYEALATVSEGKRNLFLPLVAQDSRSSTRVLYRYIRDAVQASPMLRGEIVRETADTLELTGGITIAVYPSRPQAIRGVRARCVVLDELAFFQSTDGNPTDLEMLRAARSRVATTGGKIIILSSPYGQSGALWDLHRKHYGREDSSTLVWQASAPDMNPTLPADYLERMRLDDPEAYRSEVLGEFRAGLSMLFEPDSLTACVESGVRERARDPQIEYEAGVDAASGTGADAFSVSVAHQEDDGRAVLDCVRIWRPKFDPSEVIREAAVLLKSYGCTTVTGDRYAGGFVSEGFARHGIHYQPSELDRSQLYLALLPLVNARRVALLDLPDLLKELRGLERRRGNVRDKVDHRRGQHDDAANSSAIALTLAAGQDSQEVCMIPVHYHYGDAEPDKPSEIYVPRSGSPAKW